MTFQKYVLGPLRSLQTRYGGHPFRLFIAVGKTCALAHVFTEFGYIINPASGASMLPTFEVLGDHLLISKLYRKGRGVEIGDIVSFDSVAEPGERVIKRVLGLPGDYVLKDTPGSGSSEMIQVPSGHCWVIGDNLPYSRDSRMFGPIPLALIRGKVIAKVLPWNERRWIENDLKPVDVSPST
ncbi:hypothetical protein BP6252_00664 [Coleophoma cylindrospora]|uniref:Peptidase S26 domain-containing protein n=1 Tax=Coleophoma cylindrospora TaxID=1849047 RepID=A0A3D8SQR7_9HELO|nr:hypothetical protein BP6252_00664 [Coleophoma cylindrospora]